MTNTERRLLIWCSVMLLRTTTLTPAEADEIDQLLATARADLPPIRPPAPIIDYAELSKQYAERYRRRHKIIGDVFSGGIIFIVTVIIFGLLSSINNTPFTREWAILLLGNLVAYGVFVFIYWLWGKLHASSRDKTTNLLKSFLSTLYGTTRNIIQHWR